MQTNVVIDDELLAEAMQASQLPTKQAVIEAGLHALILRMKAQEEIRSLRGKLHWEGDLEAMRNDYPSIAPGDDLAEAKSTNRSDDSEQMAAQARQIARDKKTAEEQKAKRSDSPVNREAD